MKLRQSAQPEEGSGFRRELARGKAFRNRAKQCHDAAVSSIDLSTSAKAPSLIPLIWDAAKSFDQQTIEQIEAQINQSRTAARFPSVKDTARMSDILQDIRREYLKNITTAFDSLRTAEVIDVLSKELSLAESERAKSSGSVIPALLEDLMNSYEIAAQVFINKEKETADRLIQRNNRKAAKKWR